MINKLLTLFAFCAISNISMAQNQNSEWKVHTRSINPNDYYGETVANGMIGLVSSDKPLQMENIVLNGVYDQYGRGRVSNILKGFNFANVGLSINGTMVDSSNISDMSQTLDMKAATITTEFTFKGLARVIYTVRALRQLPFTSLIDLNISASRDIDVKVESMIKSPDILKNVQRFYTHFDRSDAQISFLSATAESPTGKHKIAACTSFLFNPRPGKKPKVTHNKSAKENSIQFTKHIAKNSEYKVSVVASETSTEQFKDSRNQAERLTIYAKLQGREQLVSRHQQAWDKLWKSDIIIKGNKRDQQDVRLALYHLYSFARKGTAYSLSPMGLSGLGYNGHVFWDSELWMFPPLLVLQPEIAKSLLEYRYERLDAAKNKAFAHGYEGAMFPWESDDTGQEATPVWALTGPYEHHITAVIGIAFWNYYQVTHDKKWLRKKGYPVLKEIAKYWVSRVQKNEQGHYNINNVVGADEWAVNVDNNAFTNGAAKVALRSAVKAANVLGVKPDSMWTTVADNIPILQFKDGVTREHASYNGEKIKQVDANLLAYPLGIITSEKQIHKDLQYYEPRIGHGPAMSHSVLSIEYERLGDAEKAYRLFHRGYRPNELPPFGVLAESAGGTNPYFATGAGGMLQAVLNGFGGIEITDDGIKRLDTSLPKEWKSLKITGVGKDGETYIRK